MSSPPKRSDLPKLFGFIGRDLVWARANEFLSPLGVLPEISNILKLPNGKPAYIFYCNKLMHQPLAKVMGDLVKQGLHRELKTYDGCFNIRMIRGSADKLSSHSWGLALDFNAADNPLGGESKWSPAFIKVWKDAGFLWGGDFKRKDPMHFQYLIEN